MDCFPFAFFIAHSFHSAIRIPKSQIFFCVGSLYNKVRAIILKTGQKIGQILFWVISVCYGYCFQPAWALYPILPRDTFEKKKASINTWY